MARKRLGDVLVEAGVITAEELAVGLQRQEETKARLGETLVEMGIIDEDRLAWCLAEVLGIPLLSLGHVYIDPRVVKMLPRERCEILRILPVSVIEDALTLAMADPYDVTAYDEVRLVTGLPVRPAVATESAILRTIEKYYSDEVGLDEVVSRILPDQGIELAAPEDMEADINLVQDSSASEWAQEGESPPVVRLVNSIVRDAIKMRASDIHIEPMETTCLVRYRVDGMLRNMVSLPSFLHPRTVTRIKILGRMNIAEHRVPQDGGCRVRVRHNELDLRLSTMPTQYGEKVVIRILNRQEAQIRLDSMGLLPDSLQRLQRLLRMPQGILLLTGPTGSGKTTTLYAMLHTLKGESRNIVTLEDPIEYNIPGIIQTQTHDRAGLTFATGFRAILRQDPDVIMVGEIRDGETADIAFNAAVTGHLVLSTLHTNDSSSVPVRLKELGVSPYLITTGLKGVISQRLVRRLCVHCREGYRPDEEECRMLGLNPKDPVTLYRAVGCKTCGGTGFHGRVGVYEILLPSERFKEMIFAGATASQLAEQALREGLRDLMDEAALRVIQGLTSVEEVMRVVPLEERRGLCPQCQRSVERHYRACPYCQFPISKNLCGACGKELDPDWRTCPYCARQAEASLPEVPPSPLDEAEEEEVKVERCRSCGMILKPAWDSCPLCLHPRQGEPEPAEAPPVADRAVPPPPVTEPEPAPPEEAAPAPAEAPLVAEGPRRSLLLVIDDPATLMEVRRAAQQADFGVVQAGGGEEALRRLAGTLPAGIVVEPWLPGMDGYEFCRRVRGMARTQELPVAMVLPGEGPDETRQALAAGAAAVLTRPVDTEALAATFGRNGNGRIP